MINFDNLWDKLEVEPKSLSAIKRDWTEGKVPELPFFVVGQSLMKKHITNKLQEIDGDRMLTTVIEAKYGDGKTNALKYLELYFRKHEHNRVRFVYCRANADQPDMCMFLMQHIEASFRDDLVGAVFELRNIDGFDPKDIAYEFLDDFAFIEDYTRLLFDKANDQTAIENLISLGTGRLYSVAMFRRYNLNKLTDFNRREVFVLFMNILSKINIHVVFAIDELEKLDEKSSKRMTNYLISYRELVDLFNKINGHYIISAITGAVRIENLCPPLYERIKDDIVVIERLKTDEELKELVDLLAVLLEVNVGKETISIIANKLKNKKSLTSNRQIVQRASVLLRDINAIEVVTAHEMLENDPALKSLFEETEKSLEAESAFGNLSRSFFDPFKYYLEYLEYENVDDNLLRRDFQSVVIPSLNRACMFLFNDDSKLRQKIEDLRDLRNLNNFVVFVPENMSMSYAKIDVDYVSVQIIDYNPRELFVLLNMFRWHIEFQPNLQKIISAATNRVFD